jgi:hypothetical protein
MDVYRTTIEGAFCFCGLQRVRTGAHAEAYAILATAASPASRARAGAADPAGPCNPLAPDCLRPHPIRCCKRKLVTSAAIPRGRSERPASVSGYAATERHIRVIRSSSAQACSSLSVVPRRALGRDEGGAREGGDRGAHPNRPPPLPDDWRVPLWGV